MRKTMGTRDRVFMGFIAGVLMGNVGWVWPTAVFWGGVANIAACFFFPALAVFLGFLALVDDE